ncbi:hypothetical protein MMC31_007357 [Peltigera leucophlebia]|nr:hypothetical protein [Peltigera leucophlebia]
MDPVHESQRAEIDRWFQVVLIMVSSRERLREEIKARVFGGANEEGNEDESYACDYMDGLVEMVEQSEWDEIGDDAGEDMLNWAGVEEYECDRGWVGVVFFVNARVEARVMHGSMNIVYDHLVS